MIISKKKFEEELAKEKYEAEKILFQNIRNDDHARMVEKLEQRVCALEFKLERIAACISGGVNNA